MAQAAKLRQEGEGGSSFAVPGSIQKLGEYPRRFRQFLHDVRVEMKLVNWPSREDVRSTTLVVIVTVGFFATFFFFVDFGIEHLIQGVMKFFKH